MSGHDIATAIEWAAGVIAVALGILWVVLNTARQRQHRQRLARYESVRKDVEHWHSVESALRGDARDLPPGKDPFVVDRPANPQREEERP